MMWSNSYRNAFIAAVAFHCLIALMLLIDPSHERPVLTAASQTQASPSQPLALAQEEQSIKAVSVDNKEVMETVNRLKEERASQQRAEANRQEALKQQAEAARKQRIAEQQRVEKLKSEASKLAIAHKKQMEDETRHLKELAKQKELEEQHLAEIKKQQLQLKKQQQQESDKLAELKKKKDNEIARAVASKQAKADEQARTELARQAKAKDDLAKKQQAASAQQAALDAQNKSRIAGEVDKYKALIINAISRQWILPENANSSLSSQFRIRLAPNGLVLEVSLTRSSGDPILDRSAQSAIYKASPLPVPNDPDTFNVFREISLTVRPENARG